MEPVCQTGAPSTMSSDIEALEGIETMLSTNNLWIESFLTQPTSTYTSPLEFDSNKLMEEIMGLAVIVEPEEPVTNPQSYPSLTINPQSHSSFINNPQSYPSLTNNTQSYLSLTSNPQSYPSLTINNPQSYPSLTNNPQSYPSLTNNSQSHPSLTPVSPTIPSLTNNPQSYPSLTNNPQSPPSLTNNTQSHPSLTDLFPAMADHYGVFEILPRSPSEASSESSNTDGSFMLMESNWLNINNQGNQLEQELEEEGVQKVVQEGVQEVVQEVVLELQEENVQERVQEFEDYVQEVVLELEEENVQEIVQEVMQEVVQKENKPKKRGRKPKSETGLSLRELRRQKRLKVYEMPPSRDVEMEKKRKSALIAKQHRDRAKQQMLTVETTIKEIMKERDELKKEVEQLRMRELNCIQQLQNQYPDVFLQP